MNNSSTNTATTISTPLLPPSGHLISDNHDVMPFPLSHYCVLSCITFVLSDLSYIILNTYPSLALY